jgi:hypothetical protein
LWRCWRIWSRENNKESDVFLNAKAEPVMDSALTKIPFKRLQDK